MAGSMSFGVFADAHCGPANYGRRRCVEGPGRLAACLAVFEERRVPMCVNLGDTVDVSSDRETAFEWIGTVNRICSTFGGDIHVLLGNHDIGPLTKAEFLASCSAAGTSAFYSFDCDDFHFAVLDGNCLRDGEDFAPGNFEWTDAWVSDEQLRWLGQDLASTDSAAIVLCHENLDDRVRDGERDPHVACNAAAVRSVIEAADNVIAVVQGHCHDGAFSVVNGIPYMTLSSLGSGKAVAPCGIVTVHDDATVVLEGFAGQRDLEYRPGDQYGN